MSILAVMSVFSVTALIFIKTKGISTRRLFIFMLTFGLPILPAKYILGSQMAIPVNFSLADIFVVPAAFYLLFNKSRSEVQIDLPLLRLFFLYFLWLVISLYAGNYKFGLEVSIPSNLVTFIKFWLLIIYFYLFKNLVRNYDDLKDFLLASTLTGTLIALLGIGGALIYQVLGIPNMVSQAFRAMGTFGNPNMYSGYMLISFFLAFIYFELCGKRWQFYSLLAIFFLGLIMSASKGAMMGFVFAFITFAALSKYRVKAFAILLLLLIFASVAFLSSGKSSVYIDRLSQVGDTQTFSARSRILLWSSALKVWQKSILLGVGSGNYGKVSGVFDERWQLYGREYRTTLAQQGDQGADFVRVHSTYLSLLCETGIIGLLLFLTIIAFFFSRIVRSLLILDPSSSLHLTMVCLGAGMLGILAHSMVSNMENFRNMWCLAGVIYSVSDGALNPKMSQAFRLHQLK